MVLDFNHRPKPRELFVKTIDTALEDETQRRRDYLGGSALGEPCARRLQYDYMGAPEDAPIAARTRRIFHRGHQGEDWMAEWIRAAGFDLKTHKPSGAQFGFEDCDGRLKGHIDGVIVSGPDWMNVPALWENKVLGAKGWKSVERHGVAKAYPKYAAQIAVYQAYMKLADAPAVFTALNADTMEILAEFVPFDAALAQESIDKAVRILTATDAGEMLPRVADAPDAFACKFCPFRGACWGAMA